MGVLLHLVMCLWLCSISGQYCSSLQLMQNNHCHMSKKCHFSQPIFGFYWGVFWLFQLTQVSWSVAGAALSLDIAKAYFEEKIIADWKQGAFLLLERCVRSSSFLNCIYEEVAEWQAHEGSLTHIRQAFFTWLLKDDLQFLQRELQHPALVETISSIYSFQIFLLIEYCKVWVELIAKSRRSEVLTKPRCGVEICSLPPS